MKKALIVSLVFLSGCATAPPADDSTAINNLLSKWTDALRKGDARAAASMVTEDAEFWTTGAPPLIGRDAVRKSFTAFFAQYRVDHRFEELERVIGRDTAIIRGVEHNNLIARNNNAKREVSQRAMSILSRGRDGRWRIARGMSNSAMQPGVVR